ncbi:head maturation protease, ClpP-related [Nocardia brasiliensis]|uniref:head maturation protease, ClpP-related n=1 Tax=Nocardia brasiliensis TaxID=37326 RepID=UPI00366FE789
MNDPTARHRGSRPEPWYRIQNIAGSPVEVLIYDEIDPWWGVSAATLAKDLAAIDAVEITVRINSPGGDVYEGLAILNSLRGHRARITTVIDGLAASAASFIAMAGDEIVIGRNAEMMIHEARVYAGGDAAAMRKYAENLDRISDNIASIYAERAGGEVAAWREIMRAETWFSASEAVAAGLADRAETAPQTDLAPVARFDLSAFTYAGRRAAPAPRTPSATEAEANKKGPRMSAFASIAKRLGVAEDADETAITAALDALLARPANIEKVVLPFTDADVAFVKALAEYGPMLLEAATAAVSDGTSTDAKALAQPIVDGFAEAIDTANEALEAWGQTAEPEPPAETAPAAPAANAAPVSVVGVVAIDEGSLAELRAKAAKGEAVERQALVDDAVRTGRIAPSQRAKWLDRLAADPSEAAVLNALAPVYPVGAELGHAGTTETPIDTDDADALLVELFGKDA